MSRTLRSFKDVDSCCHEISAFNWIRKASLLLSFFAFWGLGTASAQGDGCIPSLNLTCPSNISVSCSNVDDVELTGLPVFEFESCGANVTPEVSSADMVIPSSDCSYTIIRTWTVVVPQLELSESCTQTLSVYDNEGPVFSAVENITVQCLEDVVAPEAPSAEDACGSVTEIVPFESHTAGVISVCTLTTPIGPGPDGSIWLYGALASGNAASDYWSWAPGATLTVYDDGTALVAGQVVNNGNASQIWDVSMWMENKRNWTDWSALGRSYKNDLGLAGANYLNWDYYELVEGFSTLTGAGSYAGNILYLSHQPSNYYFGFQKGIAANNRNANDGLSGWFFYNGWFNGQFVNGHGDLFTNLECTPNNPQLQCNDEFTYFYRATDSCGNQSITSIVVTVDDTIAPEFTNCPEGVTVECSDELPAVAEGVVATDNCDDDVTVIYLGQSEPTTEDGCTYFVTRTWAAFDDCDNRTDCVQTITIVDTTAPVFTFVPAAVTFECDEEIVYEDATATDNCHEVEISVSSEIAEGECPQEYTITRTFVANDGCGNSSSATQVITIVDTTAPVFNPFEVYVQVECTEVENVPAPTATDNCSEVVTVVLEEELLNSGGCLGVLERHYVAYDECGNSTETVMFIAILDTTAPIVNNPADFTVECDNVPSLPEIEIYDNCGYDVTVETSEEILPGDCANNYTIVWTWTATDYCENVTVVSTNVTVQDTTNPMFEYVPADMTIECSDETPAVEMAIAYDNCDEDVEIAFTEMIQEGNCPNNYTIVRMFRAFDNCGNEAMAVQNIFVQDTTAPVMEGVEALTFECDTDIIWETPSAMDNCSDVEITFMDEVLSEGNCFSQYARIYTATDACGNASSFTQVATVVDTTAPVITGTVELNRPCDDYAGIYVEYTDNCNEASIDFADEHVSGGCQGRIIRTYTAMDACENSSTFVQIITLVDEVAPVVTEQSEDMTVECGSEYSMPWAAFSDNCDDELEITSSVTSEGSCPEVVTYTWTATDNCNNSVTATVVVTIVDTTAPMIEAGNGGEFSCEEEVVFGGAEAYDVCSEEVVITFADETFPGSCPQSYTIVRTWTATDECGNASTASATAYVYDFTAPVFTMVGEDVTIECDAEVPAPMAEATDNCGMVTITSSDMMVEGNCANSYTIIRTYVATDECGNASEATQTISVVDTTAPVITGIVEINRPCDDFMGIYVDYSDNCAEEVSVDYADEFVSGGCQGRIIRTYTAMDACENSSTFVQIITLVDEVAPVVTEQSEDMTVECGSEYSMPWATFSDNCDNELEITSSVTSEGSCPEVVTYTWTATDNCNNSVTATVVVTIVDTTAPMIYAGNGGEFSCEEEVVFGGAEAYDVCSEEVVITFADETFPGSCPQSYTIVRTWTATDECGNASTASATAYVYDFTAPVFTMVGEDVTIECDAEVPAPMAEATDNCGMVTITSGDMMVEGNCANSYTIIRTYVATDECGNASEATQTISVVDTTAPVITGIVEINRPCDDFMGIFVDYSDNCANEVSIDYTDEHVSGGCQGRIIRTYTAMDACENSSTFVQIITLVDEVAPIVTEQSEDMTVECGSEYSMPWATFSDNCDDELEITSSVTSEGSCPEVVTYTWTATDNCNNSVTATVVVTIVDTTAPMWYSEGYSETVSCGTEYMVYEPYAYDMCSEVTIDSSMETILGECPSNYTEVYTYTAVDACGNTAEPLVISITYVDDAAPVWMTVPSSNEISCDAMVPMEVPTAMDNCSEFEIAMTEEIIEGQCANNYIIVRTWVATDACGNASEPVSVSYYIYDFTAPVISTELTDLSYECPIEIVPVEIAATDNCSEVSIESSVETIWTDECGNGYFLVSYVATDACFNATEASYYVSIYDETAPELSEMPENLVLDCEMSLPEAPVVTATDNCNGEVTVDFSEEIVGDLPAEGSIADCNILTPVRPANNPCNYAYDWAMALFAMPSAHRYYQVAEGNLVQYPNGTIHVIATMTNAMNPANGFYVDVTFANALDWAAWSTQAFPTGFKADCGGEGVNHEDWMYYILQAGEGAELVGFGAYTGSSINLVHAPSNNYFGFQLGNGANNYNGDDNGFGGWFTYNGVFLVNGESIMSGNASGAGDFAFNLDCCPDYEVVRTWTAMDCTGNVTMHSQTISWAGNSNTTPTVFTPEVETAQVSKGNIEIVNIYPNPSNVNTQIKVVSNIQNNIVVDVVDVTGRVIAKIYNGQVDAGVVYNFTLNSGDLNNGLYQVRMSSATEVVAKQLQVIK